MLPLHSKKPKLSYYCTKKVIVCIVFAVLALIGCGSVAVWYFCQSSEQKPSPKAKAPLDAPPSSLDVTPPSSHGSQPSLVESPKSSNAASSKSSRASSKSLVESKPSLDTAQQPLSTAPIPPPATQSSSPTLPCQLPTSSHAAPTSLVESPTPPHRIGTGLPLFINFGTEKHSLDVPPGSTVGDVRRAVIERDFIPGAFDLEYAGKSLSDEIALADAGILPESTLEATQKLANLFQISGGNIQAGNGVRIGYIGCRIKVLTPIGTKEIVFKLNNLQGKGKLVVWVKGFGVIELTKRIGRNYADGDVVKIKIEGTRCGFYTKNVLMLEVDEEQQPEPSNTAGYECTFKILYAVLGAKLEFVEDE